MNSSDSNPSALARRCAAMGLGTPPSAFPPGAVSLAQRVPWWRLWPRDPYRDLLQGTGAAVFPAAASGVLCLTANAPYHQAVFASLLPLLPAEGVAERWTEWVLAASLQEDCVDLAPLLGVLEYLLQDRPEPERLSPNPLRSIS